MASLAELKKRRAQLNRLIVAERKRKKASLGKRAREKNPIRRKYPGFASMMDNAARNMWR